MFEQSFATKEAAEAAVESEQKWSKYYVKDTLKGRRIKYRCNEVKYRSKQCPAGLYLLYHSDDSNVSLFRCTSDHVHDTDGQSIAGKLPSGAQNVIRECFNRNMKPKAIRFALSERGYGVVQTTKLSAFLKKLRLEKYGHKINFGALNTWLENNMHFPTNDTDAFVVQFEMDDKNENDPRFRFVHLIMVNI